MGRPVILIILNQVAFGDYMMMIADCNPRQQNETFVRRGMDVQEIPHHGETI